MFKVVNRVLAVSLVVFVAIKAGPVSAKSAIFFHPDGMGVNTWQTLRYIKSFPKDGLNWDKLENMGVYIGTLSDKAVATSNGGATAHAYGVKAKGDSYGLIDGKQITAKSGFRGTIIEEAKYSGLKTALINSGNIVEPGTGVFASRAARRYDYDTITEQIIKSGVDIILSGGEKHMLPEGEKGRHGVGSRNDGKNLIKEAEARGYKIVYTNEELQQAVKEKPEKLLGVFAENHTFNDLPEDQLRARHLPRYYEYAPTVGQMVEAALVLLEGKDFLMIAEEEATDNFANKGNPDAVIDAAMRSDEALGIMLDYRKRHSDTMIITTSDSDAGGMQIKSGGSHDKYNYTDANGKKIFFEIHNVGTKDYAGGILVRSTQKLPSIVDNTQIYSLIRSYLIDEEPKG